MALSVKLDYSATSYSLQCDFISFMCDRSPFLIPLPAASGVPSRILIDLGMEKEVVQITGVIADDATDPSVYDLITSSRTWYASGTWVKLTLPIGEGPADKQYNGRINSFQFKKAAGETKWDFTMEFFIHSEV